MGAGHGWNERGMGIMAKQGFGSGGSMKKDNKQWISLKVPHGNLIQQKLAKIYVYIKKLNRIPCNRWRILVPDTMN